MSRRDEQDVHGDAMSRRKAALKPYPVWVCRECADAAGFVPREGHCSTQHAGICDVCGHLRYVTEPRDYGYIAFEGHVKP